MSTRTAVAALLIALTAAVPAMAQRRHAARQPVVCSSWAQGSTPTGTVAIDASSVYYGDAGLRGVYRVAKGGGKPLLLAPLPGGPTNLMVIDGENIYLTAGAGSWDRQDLWVVSKSGGTPRLLAGAISLLKQIAVDDQFVYWASYGTVVNDPYTASDGKIERIGKDGSNRSVLASGLSGAESVALDDAWVYFAESGRAIGNSSKGARRVPKDGGAVQHLYNGDVDTLAVNENDLYLLYVNFDNGRMTISQLAKTGGPVKHTLTDAPLSHSPLIFFDGRLYYTTQGSPGKAIASTTLDLQGRIVHVQRDVFNSDGFAIDDCAFYVATVTPNDFLLERIRR